MMKVETVFLAILILLRAIVTAASADEILQICSWRASTYANIRIISLLCDDIYT